MEWTKEKPTKPGCYWVKSYGIVCITDAYKQLDVMIFGDDNFESLDKFINHFSVLPLWYGPLEEPK